MTETLAMFPLHTVLFPGVAIPLHVFEPRYRALTRDCLDGDRRFGVVLIERGSEVGGGDVRSMVGTVARIAEAAELPDGRWFLMTVPRAEVDLLEEPAAGPAASERSRDVERLLRRALALKAELGEPAPPATVDLDPDPAVAAYQAAALAPLGPFDCQRLLEAAGPDERLAALAEILSEELDVLARRAAGG